MTVQLFYHYSFISLICFGLLIQNYINVRHYGNRTPSGLFFRLFVLAFIGCSVLEILYGLREAGVFGRSAVFAYTEEILYAVITMFAAYFWYITSELYQKSRTVATWKRRILISIPLLVMVVVTALTPIHHLNFYFEDGHYIRGPLVLVFAALLGAFIVGTGVAALVNSFRRKFYLDRSYFRIIFLYAVILIIAQGLQIIFGSVMPFRTMGATLVIYIVQQRYIKDNIYMDRLTGANNRNAAERYLHSQIESKNTAMQVAMIDADHFKAINDTFGHQAGDRALQLLAKAFMTNLTGGSFFARYGGDEFLLMSLSEDPTELEKIVQNAKLSLKNLCKQEKVGFDLDFSCGIVQRTPEMETIPDVLEAADRAMYQCKAEKRAERR